MSDPDPKPVGSRRRLGLVVKLALVVLLVAGALVATGYIVYEQAQKKAVDRELNRAQRMVALDTPIAYGTALKILDKVAARRPNNPRLAGVVAEIRAFLWGRFGGDEQARLAAMRSLSLARRLDADGERVTAVEGYHLLFKGHYAEAARHAEAALLTHRRSARLGYVLGVARYHLGDLTAAEATFKLAQAHNDRFLPARVALGRIQRQRGHLKSAEATLRRVLVDSPEHLEALIELQLIAEARRDKGAGAGLRLLLRRARPYPPLLAIAKLAAARQSLARGEWEQARRQLQESALLAPDDPEIALQQVDSQNHPGGDARKAWSNQERIVDRSREYQAAAAIFAQVALAVGQPARALGFLRRPVPAALPKDVQDRIVATRVNAAHELDQPELADRLCATVLSQSSVGRLARVSCLAHAARQRREDMLKAELRRVTAGVESELVAGLRDYQRRKYNRAVASLTKVVRSPGSSPWTLALLAEALQHTERAVAALPFLRRAVRESAQDYRMRLQLVRGLLLAHRPERALKLWNGLLSEKPSGARTLMDLGELGLMLKQWKDVAGIAKGLVRTHATSGHGPYLQGVLLLRGEQRRKAREKFEAALMRDPSHVPAMLGLARLAFWRGDVGGGRVLFDKAWSASGRDPAIQLELARAYLKYNFVYQARRTYVRAMLQYRGLGALYLASGAMSELGDRLAALKKYRHRAVLRILRWSLRLYWRNPHSQLRIGRFLEARGFLDEAIKSYQRATRFAPELSDGYYYLGALLLAAKRDALQSEQALRRFLDLTPFKTGRRARNAQKWLARAQARRKYFQRRQ